MTRVGRQDQHGLDLVFAQAPGTIRSCSALVPAEILPASASPELFDFGAMRFLGDNSTVGQNVAQAARIADATAGIGLSGQRERSGSWLSDLAGQQVQVMHQVVGPYTGDALV